MPALADGMQNGEMRSLCGSQFVVLARAGLDKCQHIDIAERCQNDAETCI